MCCYAAIVIFFASMLPYPLIAKIYLILQSSIFFFLPSFLSGFKPHGIFLYADLFFFLSLTLFLLSPSN